MDFKQISFCVLLAFQGFWCEVGSSYRIFILPEPESFCPGIFTGDDCRTWPQYSSYPFVADHSTTLIFTPGKYNPINSNYLNVANVKSFSMIGDHASISFGLSLSNIGQVGIYNLTFQSVPYSINVQSVRSFVMENCTISKMSKSSSLYARSSTVIVRNTTFSKSGIAIKGDHSTIKIYGSQFTDTSGSGVISASTASSLEIVDCQIITPGGNSDVILSQGNINVTNSRFLANSIATFNRNYNGRGNVIRANAQYNIVICNSTFSNWTMKRAVIESYSSSQWILPQFRFDIIDSVFVNCNRAIYSIRNVTIENSGFYNIIQTGTSGNIVDGGVVYSTESVTAINCTFDNTKTSSGNGGAIYSKRNVLIVDSNVQNTNANLGGAIYTAPSQTEIFRENGHPNIQLLRSTFIHNSANSGGVLYTPGRYNYHIKITDSTFVSNRVTTDVSGGGGVGHIGNTSLSITNSTFNDNAAANGGVFDINYIHVNITDSTFSGNSAGNNGGVFYGGNYSMNFTIANTIFTDNDADNGGVFYVRRHNSNIDVFQSQFSGNTAYNQGSVFDVRGVTLVFDRGTLIGNNSYSATNVSEADPDDYVINACVSKVSVFGLGVEPDPVYPMYCLIYSQDNSSYNSSTADTENTTMAITHSRTRDQQLLSTTSRQSKLPIRSIDTTTKEEHSPTTKTVTPTSTPTTTRVSPHATTTSNWLRETESKQTSMSVMPFSVVSTLKVQPTTVHSEIGDTLITTFSQKPCATPYPVINTGSETSKGFQDSESPITIGTDGKPPSECDTTYPWNTTSDNIINPPTTSSSGTTAQAVARTEAYTSTYSLSTSTAYTTDSSDTVDTTDTADTAGTTNSDHHPTRKSQDETTTFDQHDIVVTVSHSTLTKPNTQTSTTSLKSDELSTKPSVQTSDQHQVDRNQYTDVMTLDSKIQTLLQVTIVSVSLLSIMAVLMCMIMMALVVIACKNRSDSQRGGYSKLPPLSDRDANGAVALEETNAEYSFTEA